MKKIFAGMLVLVMVFSITACGSSNVASSGNSGAAESEVKPVELKLAHNLAEDHPLGKALQLFADEVAKNSNGEVTVKVFGNGLLGSEKDTIEQLQNGGVDLIRTGAASLENFSPIFSTFTVPYLFNSVDHFYKVMDSDIVNKVYEAAVEQNIYGLTYYNGGARSFYTKDKVINTPADLKGLKIRVMQNPSSIKMMEAFNASAVPMAYGDIYTALQQGVIDGAENNPTALTLGKHGEVAKFYSIDEHARIPDFLVISKKTWDSLSDANKEVIKNAAITSTEFHKELWAKEVDKALTEAENDLGVTITYPDKAPFREAVQPIYDEIANDSTIGPLVEEIQSIK